MECNKIEAVRARDIAVQKFTDKDIAGAKKFALKAQTLYPDLEGLSQLLATLEVYISAEKKVSGFVDWYAILGVDPKSDDETIKKNYRRLALVLHPDKNKSVGADGAFRILSEAWSFLSDTSKKMEYDKKLPMWDIFQKVSLVNPSMPGQNGFHNAKRKKTNISKNHTRDQQNVATPLVSTPSAFWTACPHCRTQYEYLRKYLKQTLKCPNCRKGFSAVERPAPPNGSAPWKHASLPNAGPLKNNVGVRGTQSFSSPANAFQLPGEKTNKGVGLASGLASHVVSGSHKGEKPAKKRRIDAREVTNQFPVRNNGAGARIFQKANPATERVDMFVNKKPNSSKDLSPLELRNMLMKKASGQIGKKLNEWKMVSALNSSDIGNTSNEEVEKMEKEVEKAVENVVKSDAYKPEDSLDTKNNRDQTEKLSADVVDDAGADTETIEYVSMTVPDPDFHDFDNDRTEKSFGENQVWAAYDDDDGMPRYYVMIHNVVSLKPFKMKISWLNSKSNSELAPLNWVGSGFPKTCGELRIGKHGVYKTLNSFSHKVKWTKGARGAIQIYPKKGDVWALYRNWSADWSELTPDEVIHKYDMVEVLDDYDEERGAVTVAPLVKVAGFKTVFQQNLNPDEFKLIKKEELFRFSHQVPSYLLTGQEAPNAPKGCRELDPAATPLELLNIISLEKDKKMADAAENGDEKLSESGQKN